MAAQTHIREISPDEVRQKIERGEGVCLVDVRTPVEYAQCHIPNILLLPMDKFAHGFRAVLAPDDEIVCICEHGVRSESAARYLAAQGYSNVATMLGGMASYAGPVESGLPGDPNSC
ncbi:MAG: rhodanese-like domain-containing protein [Armatimonadota bacterium]|nr:rhodanese-like domain-containing protein [Armatimonadota bacterium]